MNLRQIKNWKEQKKKYTLHWKHLKISSSCIIKSKQTLYKKMIKQSYWTHFYSSHQANNKERKIYKN